MYVMKNYSVLFISIILFITGCLPEPNKVKLSPEDSLRIAINDSIHRVKKDSTDKVKAEKLAHLNRPWKLGTFNDEFGEPTKDKFIKTDTEGYFSNSATTNEYLYVKVLITNNAAGIFLHEYSRSSPAEKFIGSATIKLKNSEGEKLRIISVSEWNHNGGLLITNKYGSKGYSKFRNFLRKSAGIIKVVIYDDYSSSYKFDIDATGFTKEFSLLK